MFTYPDINPVALALGPLKIHWYGLMYILGFALSWGLATLRAKRADSGWTSQQVSDLIFYAALGVVIGGRVGYMLFYDLSNFLSNPLLLFKVWDGGMSFHGGLLGVLLALIIFSRKTDKPFWRVADFVAPLVPLGLAAGRIGNFINGELWGRATDVSWAMVFPHVDQIPRHASQLYESFFEGIVLFIIIWFYSAKPRPAMSVSGLFLICYGVFRFGLEFFRQPDPQLGFIAYHWLTMGQVLSLPMVLAGVVLLIIARQRGVAHEAVS